MERVRWKIGNGESVKVWNDKWTPSPLVCGGDIGGVRVVADLIDSD